MQACGRPCAGERPILRRRAMSADERGRCVQPRPSSRRDASRSARRVGSGSLYLAVKRITRSAADAIETRWQGETTSGLQRSEEHTYELQSLMRLSYTVFSL